MTLVYVLRLLAVYALDPTRALRAGVSTARRTVHRYSYVGAHRPGHGEPSTLQRVTGWIREHAQPVMLDPDTAPPPVLVPPAVVRPFFDEAPLCPPMYPEIGDRYAHRAGVGAYAHLRQEELDATIRWDRLKRAMKTPTQEMAPVVDLKALRVRGAVPTVHEVDDEWLADVGVAS